MITVQIIFGLLCALLIQKSAYAIYDPQNDGVKSKGFHRDQRISEPIVMHHQYSQVASNRPLDSDDKSRQGRTSYTNDAENYVAQHGSNCPPNATGQFPYLLNCRQFLNCWKGRGYIQSCAPGTVFNPDTRECDNPQKVICLNYRGDANPNSQFAKIQSGETTVQGRVPNFANTPSATTSVQCSPESNGLEPHPFECEKFLNCANGITYIQVCGPGTVFNPISLVCDFAYNVECGSRRVGKAQRNESSISASGVDSGTQHHHGAGWRSPSSQGPDSRGPYYNRHNHNHTSSWESSNSQPRESGWSNPNSQGTDATRPYYNRQAHNHTSGWGSSNGQQTEAGWSNHNSQGADSTQPLYNRHHHNHTSSWGNSNGQQTQPGWSYPNIQGTDSTRPSYNHHTHNRTADWGSSNGQQTGPGWSNPNIQGTDSTRPSYNHHTHNRTADWESSNGQQTGPGWSNPNIQGTDSTRPYYNHHAHNHTSGWGSSNNQQTNTNGQQEGSTRPYYNQHTHNHGSRNPNSPGDTNSTWRNSNNQQTDQARHYSHHHHHPSHGHRSGHGQPPAYTPQPNEPWIQSSYNSMQHSNPNRPTSGNPNPPPTNQWNPTPSDSSQIDSTWQEPSSLPLNSSRRLYHVQEANVNQMAQSAAGSTVNSGPSKTTTTIYYAQPVNNYDDLTDYDYGEQVQQKQIPLDLTPPDLHKNHSWTTINHNLTPSSSNNPNIVYSTNNDSNLYGGLLPPRAPTQSTPRVTYSSIHDHLVPPPLEPPTPTRPEFIVPVPYGDLLPPLPDAKTTAKPNPPVLYPPPPSPTKPLQLNETKVYRVYPVYPPVREDKSLPGFNATSEIYYSPPYSGVSQGKFKPDFTDQTVTGEEPSGDHIPVYNPEQDLGFSNFKPSPVIPLPTEVHTKPKEDSTRPVPVYTGPGQGNPYPAAGNLPDTKSKPQPEFSEEPFRKVIPIYSRPDSSTPALVSPAIKTSTNLPKPYNREYYKPSQAHNSQSQSDHDETSTMPISEALKALFRPYYNRNGSVTDDVVQKMDEHIMKLTKPKPLPTTTEPQINFAGEEHSLSEGAVHETNSSDESGENVTERPNRHQHHFHHHHHNHQNHHHHHLPDHHSQEFHRKHPNIRNPFATNDLEESEQPKSDAIDVRFDNVPRNPRKDQNPSLDTSSPTCQFDCNNGNCINNFLVCDGVNDCGNRFDEENCERIGYEVRLSSEEGKLHMGRVEVKVNGKWGYVCDDKFGMRAADVLCRELGFKLGASEIRPNSYYPPNVQMIDDSGIPPFAMDEVDCLGNETSIRECNFKGWGVHDCSAEEVVGVVCKIPVMKCPPDYWLCKTSEECIAIGFLCDSVPDCADKSDESDDICDDSIQYRLAGSNGNEMEGRAEVKYRGTWGSICDDDFNKKEAYVFCRALGFLGEATVIKNAYGAGTGAIWLDQVSCFGNETSLDQCTHFAWGEHNCHHSEDVSVRCSERSADYATKSATTTTTDLPVQVPSEDIDLYLYKTPEVQRSSKAVNHHKRCGQINEHIVDEFENSEKMARVVNGTKALRGHHPWQASIRAKGHNGKSSHWCGAILITQMHILTAAHCLIGFPKGAYFIRIGDHYSQIAESSEVDIFIQNWYIHEDFRKGHHMNNDIAIIVLKSPVVFNDYIQPICLPPKDAKYDEGMSCTISGWGSIQSGISTPSNNLKAAHVPIISQAVCKEPYVYGDAITDGMFCAGYLDEGVDACDGDSGGPLACSTQNGETLYGIISWGQHCGQANKPGVYVKITHYLDWIMEKILFSIKAKE